MNTIATLENRLTPDVFVSAESAEATRPNRRLLCFGWEMGLPTSVTETQATFRSDALAQRFHGLATEWRKECAHLSSIREMVLHPAYQQIVGMGRVALPYILAELERQPDHWFWALRAITQEDPVPPAHRGNVAQMARDWLRWARESGLRR